MSTHFLMHFSNRPNTSSQHLKLRSHFHGLDQVHTACHNAIKIWNYCPRLLKIYVHVLKTGYSCWHFAFKLGDFKQTLLLFILRKIIVFQEFQASWITCHKHSILGTDKCRITGLPCHISRTWGCLVSWLFSWSPRDFSSTRNCWESWDCR